MVFGSYTCFAQVYDSNHVLDLLNSSSSYTLNLDVESNNITLTQGNSPYLAENANFTISDEHGDLTAYSNGLYIYDRNGAIMQGGSGFDYDSYWTAYRDVYGFRPSRFEEHKYKWIPYPGHEDQFLIFYPSFRYQDNPAGAADNFIRYTRIDGKVKSGDGGVIEKDELLYEGGEDLSSVAVVRHHNGDDFWMCLFDFSLQKFVSFLITSEGIIGPFYNDIDLNVFSRRLNDRRPFVIFNDDGTILGIYEHNDIYFYQFDPCHGSIGELICKYSHPELIRQVLFTGLKEVKFLDYTSIYIKSVGKVYNAVIEVDSLKVTHQTTTSSLDMYSNTFRWKDNSYISFSGRDLIMVKNSSIPNGQESIIVEKDFLPAPILSASRMYINFRQDKPGCATELFIDPNELLPPESFTFYQHNYHRALRKFK